MRQLPTLPARCQASTLGSMRLNFRVRYGNGWVPHDIVTAMVECAHLHTHNYTERKRKRRLEKIKKAFILLLKVLLVLAILAGIAAFLFVSPVFNITEVVVENAGKITENAYIALSEIQIRRKYISNKQIKN